MTDALYERARAQHDGSPAWIGMSHTELGKTSFLDFVRCALSGNGARPASCREAEYSHAIAARLGRHPRAAAGHGVFVPLDVLATRDLNVATGTGGGYLVSSKEPQGFSEYLYARSIVGTLGATLIPGLKGNATIPAQSATTAATWLADETAAITESAQTFREATLTPKTVGCLTKISRQLLTQTNRAIELIVMRDQARSLGAAVDTAAIGGSGASGQPQGIVGTVGVGAVTGTTLGYTGLVNFQEDVFTGTDIDLASAGYASSVPVAALLMGRHRTASTNSPLWEGALDTGTVLGHRALASSAVPAATMVFGTWSDLVIGEFGVLELMVDPFTAFKTGVLGVRAMYSIDIAVRRPANFSVATAIT